MLITDSISFYNEVIPADIKVHESNMGSSSVLSAPGGPHAGPMNLAISNVS